MKRMICVLLSAALLTACEESETESRWDYGTVTESRSDSQAQTITPEERINVYLDMYLDSKQEQNEYEFISDHPADIHVLDHSYDPNYEAETESRLAVLFQRDQDPDYRYVTLWERGKGELNSLAIPGDRRCGAVVFGERQLWYPDPDGTLHFCNYDLQETTTRRLPDCQRIAYDPQTDTAYGVSTEGAVVKCGADGQVQTLCRPAGISVRQICPCSTELIWQGITEDENKYPVRGTVSLADGSESHQIRTDGGGWRLCPLRDGAVIADADGYDAERVTGEIIVRNGGQETVITPKHPIESGNVFASPDGSIIFTEYLIYVPDKDEVLDPGAQVSATEMLCAYRPDGTLLWEAAIGCCGMETESVQPNVAFLNARNDIDRMIFLPLNMEAVWIMKSSNLLRLRFDADSLREMGAVAPQN